MRRPLLPLLLILGLSLPCVGKPVHLDDANFLALARGAAADPWRPHAIEINWQGTRELAFDVLSNPPGVAWFLAPLADAAPWAQHLWMYLWLLPACWGAWRLSKALTGRPAAGLICLMASPVAVLATQSLMPDLPLYACTLAGVAGLVTGAGKLERRWPWALVLGCAALFRYSGLAVLALPGLWALLHRNPRAAGIHTAAAVAPFGLLAAHDLSAYGQIHFIAMMGFQGISDTPTLIYGKLVAALAMLGGGAVLPVLCWARWRPAAVGLGVGVLLGGAATILFGQEGIPAVATVVATAAGGATLLGAIQWRTKEEVFLSVWLLIGLLFLLKLRFTATRYWLPFLAPAALLVLRQAGPRLVAAATTLTPILSLALVADDWQLARTQRRLADQAQQLRGEHSPALFAGHWGWQHHLEAAGWEAIDDDATLPVGALFARSSIAWPQDTGPDCRELLAEVGVQPMWPGPRVHTRTGGGNFHASAIYGTPPTPTFAPWSIGDDPIDVAQVWRIIPCPQVKPSP